ncbi:MAG: hypothetical protein ACLFSC_00990 [Wenzhouxiangella sp.]
MKKDDDGLKPTDLLSEETLRKADELCHSLSSHLSIDKRGEANFYRGAFVDLDSLAHRQYEITVADIGGQPWLTVISHDPIPETGNGLLVFNVPPGDHRRYIGHIQTSRRGFRESDGDQQYFAIFDILRDARRD